MSVYLMRHGQAFHNQFYGNNPDDNIPDSDTRYLDPGLTSSAINRICVDRQLILKMLPQIDIILMSPLKRAIQTGLYLYLDQLISPELYVTYSVKEIKDVSDSDPITYRVNNNQTQDLDLSSFQLYSKVTYLDNKELSSIDECINLLQLYLKRFTNKNVLVITHSGVIRKLVNKSLEPLQMIKYSSVINNSNDGYKFQQSHDWPNTYY